MRRTWKTRTPPFKREMTTLTAQSSWYRHERDRRRESNVIRPRLQVAEKLTEQSPRPVRTGVGEATQDGLL